GGCGWPDDYPIKKARPSIYSFPQIPFPGRVAGYDLFQLPHIQTDEQRTALTLFREANASNNEYLSFIFFWQVLEVGKGTKPEAFVDKSYRKQQNALGAIKSDIDQLQLAGRALGNYLL